MLIEEAGRIGICSDSVLWGSRTTFDQVYKGRALRRHLGHYFFGEWRGGGLVCHLTIFLQHE